MTQHPERRRMMRILAVILTASWAGIAIAVASAYRPGGPIDIVVALVCFAPVLVADAGVVWPPTARTHRGRVALGWLWIIAVLLAIPVLYGIAVSLGSDGHRNLVPSIEAAYAGALALATMTFFSVVGLVHHKSRAAVFQRRATWLTAGLTVLLTAVLGLAFVFVALVNDQALRQQEPATSRFGPTDPDRIPPFCDEPLLLSPYAVISIEAASSSDGVGRGQALLEGRRAGRDEAWGGSWSGLDGSGQQAYLRIGSSAWLNTSSDDPDAPGSSWRTVRPEPFGLVGVRQLTMDGPPHAIVNVPRGSIVAEDLGLEVIEGARARHCRTFIDGPTALDTFLPLRWLLVDDSFAPDGVITRWRGEMDWWVFLDGQLGRSSVEVSGSRAATVWASEGVRSVLEATLEVTERDVTSEVVAPFDTQPTPAVLAPGKAPSPAPATSPSGRTPPALGSTAP